MFKINNDTNKENNNEKKCRILPQKTKVKTPYITIKLIPKT